MGTMNVETSWLGDAMNNMFNEMEAAPNNAAKMALTMEQIKKARAVRIKEENVLFPMCRAHVPDLDTLLASAS